MKIYFAGSIRGGRDDKELYLEIVNLLKKHGEVLAEHIGDVKLTAEGEKDRKDIDIFKRDISWIDEADVVVAEVTTPSIGVGYEIAYAEKAGKRILCIFREGAGRNLSAMISGNENIEVSLYKETPDLENIFNKFFAQ